MTSDQIQFILRQKYDPQSWLHFVREILPGTDVFAAPQVIPAAVPNAPLPIQLARVRLGDGKQLAVLEVKVSDRIDLLRNRVSLRNLVACFIDQAQYHGVLAVFVSKNRDYRFTFAARETAFDEQGNFSKRETAPRRYTYILGPNESCRTAAERFARLAAKGTEASIADVVDAFSVEKLNKEFFAQYKEHYQKFVDHALAEDIPHSVFGVPAKITDEKERDLALKPVRDFVKKLLGRLVFIHFLQKKGWLGCPAGKKEWSNGQPDFLQQLFAATKNKAKFHSQSLGPLFYEALNRADRPGDLFSTTGTRVPYLNGGLFEKDFPGVDRIDFPAELFANILEFFGHYNFTIDENDPEDQEIGIDPEMLGHIFENLLEDNKDKGAYYTPKAVVQYMCQQSLIHALAGRFQGDTVACAEIERFIRLKEPIDPKKNTWLARHATALETHLDDLHICDPAIGSGAFPIGLLQEIYWTKLALHPALDRGKTKRAIIQRSIHGVDLDAGAVEIARLRFWLALIVDEEEPLPLPNLDYQIMQGNSLLESFEGIDLSHLSQPAKVGITLLGTDQTEMGFGSARQIEIAASSESRDNLVEMQEK